MMVFEFATISTGFSAKQLDFMQQRLDNLNPFDTNTIPTRIQDDDNYHDTSYVREWRHCVSGNTPEGAALSPTKPKLMLPNTY